VPFAGSAAAHEPRPPGDAAVLEVSGLTTRFDVSRNVLGRARARVFAVEDVSFEVAEGETLSLVGESGSGKSTIARSVLRLAEPQAGSVRFLGTDMMALDRRALRARRRRMQMVFQDPYSSLNPRMRVGQALTEPLLAHGIVPAREAGARVAALLGQVGLDPDAADRYPHAFSGGQRQRICIARALAVEPRLLIADEAVSALDVRIKAQIADLLMEIQRATGVAILFISHDMALVERISHRVAVVYRGEIVEIGPTRRIVDAPAHSYTRHLLGAVPIPDPAAPRPVAAAAIQVPSPIFPPDHVPARRSWREIAPGHRAVVDVAS
jgi:peptide/nickel transport system ATP-binding protein